MNSMILPTIRQLQFFIALTETQNFSKAAEQCHVSQPALSKSIQDMEAILGHQLFNRGKRDVTLTALGAEFLSDAKQIITQTEVMMTRAQAAKGSMTGPLRMGVIPTIAPYMLPDILPVIQTTYPNLELQIFEDQSHRLAEKLERGELDIILLAFPYKTPKAKQVFLFEEPFYCAMPKVYDILIKDGIKAEDLKPDELLLLAEGHCLSDHALQACNLKPTAHRKTYSASSLTTLIQMVSHGYGITLLPEMVIMNSQIPDTIKTVPFETPKPTRKIGLAWQAQSPREADFLKLRDIMKKGG